MTALAATIGIGSITGVATAIAIGGVGSLFWMWVAAMIGMATKYAEGVLAIKYRVIDEKGQMCGGPMYYLEKGLKSKWLGIFFAGMGAIAALGTGNMVQAHSVAHALSDLGNVHPYVTGIILAACTGFALFKGIKSIGKISSILVPCMAAFYLIGGLIVLFLRIEAIPAAFILIVKSAFTGHAAAGGFVGASIMQAIQMGVARGVFSNEAGLGTSAIAAAAAKTDTPGRQALISMCSVFITTCIVCTITGIAIVVSGVLGQTDDNGAVLNGSSLALHAFDRVIKGGGLIVTIALIPFAYSTILGWAYYGEKCVEYLFGSRGTKFYRIFFVLVVLSGSVLSLQVVWSFSNIMNGLMAFPNLIGLLGLASVVTSETQLFERLVKSEREKKLELEGTI
jgi:AGCS family alanine or glycine:cation symporter